VDGAHIPRRHSLFNSLRALPTLQPLQSVYSYQPALAKRIADIVCQSNETEPFDIIHVEHLRGAQYGVHLKSQLAQIQPACAVPVVWDSVDSISLLFKQASASSKSIFGRWLTRLELGRTERYEGWLLRQFDRVLVTSESDKRALAALPYPGQGTLAPIEVLPNGVDLDYFSGKEQDREPATLVISGKMSYHANVTMALNLVDQIMPRVWGQRPDVKLLVVGKDPPREIKALGANPKITVTGTVDDIRPYLRQATAAVVPIAYGVGIQNKVLEAMACGTPVISTPQAVSAVTVRHEEEVLVAKEPAAFAGEVLKLLNDPVLQKRIGSGGRRYVETYHDWYKIAARLEDLYLETIPKNQKVLIPNF
jgi:polysaccharide biosynthesis protein PslH